MKKGHIIPMCFMVLILLVGFVTITRAEIPDNERYKDFVYNSDNTKDGETAVINYKGTKKTVVIPAEINGLKVTEVFNWKKAKTVKTLHIPETVIYLRVSEMPSLTKAVINSKNKNFIVKNKLVVSKNKKLLCSCPGGIKKVNLPKTVTEIKSQAFLGANIKEIKLPKNINVIGRYAFSKCKKLIMIVLNKGLKKIESFAFSDCKKIDKIVINSRKKLPRMEEFIFTGAKKGIKFYCKNITIAKQLKKRLMNNYTRVKEAKIYVGDKLIYNNVSEAKPFI